MPLTPVEVKATVDDVEQPLSELLIVHLNTVCPDCPPGITTEVDGEEGFTMVTFGPLTLLQVPNSMGVKGAFAAITIVPAQTWGMFGPALAGVEDCV